MTKDENNFISCIIAIWLKRFLCIFVHSHILVAVFGPMKIYQQSP